MVAYGTNDWSNHTFEEFERDSVKFYQRLTSLYPGSKIFALAPIWRKDFQEYRKFGEFHTVREFIQNIAKSYENVFFIDCFEFVPFEETYYADKRLHPNSLGFEFYGTRLFEAIKPNL